MNRKRELVLDTETTGLDVENGDKIIEIGIIELIDGIQTNNFYHQYVNPEREIDKNAQKIHGLTNEFLKDKPKFNEIAEDFESFLSDDTIIIHNAEFDLKFINYELENCGKTRIKNEIIDTLKLARKEFPNQSVSLDALCKKLKIDNTRALNHNMHGAKLDAKLLSNVYLKLTSGKQAILELSSTRKNHLKSRIQQHDESLKFSSVSRENMLYLPREDYVDHKKFISRIKSSIWDKIDHS